LNELFEKKRSLLKSRIAYIFKGLFVVYLAFPLWFDLQFFYATTQRPKLINGLQGYRNVQGLGSQQVLTGIEAKTVPSKRINSSPPTF
jgi:hypothetical protein